MPRLLRLAILGFGLVVASCSAPDTLSTKGYPGEVPPMRWDHRPEAQEWTRATLAALATHGAALETLAPVDIDRFCPAYRTAGPEQRRAF